MKIELRRMMKRSKAGYFHIPILDLSFGSNEFMIIIAGIGIIVKWGNAIKSK